jgi:hypothetical protein
MKEMIGLGCSSVVGSCLACVRPWADPQNCKTERERQRERERERERERGRQREGGEIEADFNVLLYLILQNTGIAIYNQHQRIVFP